MGPSVHPRVLLPSPDERLSRLLTKHKPFGAHVLIFIFSSIFCFVGENETEDFFGVLLSSGVNETTDYVRDPEYVLERT